MVLRGRLNRKVTVNSGVLEILKKFARAYRSNKRWNLIRNCEKVGIIQPWIEVLGLNSLRHLLIWRINNP